MWILRNSSTTKGTKVHEESIFAFAFPLCAFVSLVVSRFGFRSQDLLPKVIGVIGLGGSAGLTGKIMATVAVRRLSAQEISHAIITSAMKVHTELGPGLLESTYEACLQYELRESGFRSEAQVGLPVVYHGVRLELGYRMDLLVENLVIVEIKSVERISPVHQAQVISYLKLSGKSIGLLINFNVVHLKDGIQRFVNGTSWREKQEL